MNIKETLFELRKDKKLSRNDVAAYLTSKGLKTSYKMVSNWETGNTKVDIERFVRLCELFEARDVPKIFCGVKDKDDSELNELMRKSKELYDCVARLQNESVRLTRPKPKPVRIKTRTIPIYDLPVSAGSGQFLDSESFELMDIDDSVPPGADYALRASGDSMYPKIEDGQIIFVKKQQTLNDGDIGIFLLNGDAYCKIFKKNALLSLNPEYKPINIGEHDELIVLGKLAVR